MEPPGFRAGPILLMCGFAGTLCPFAALGILLILSQNSIQKFLFDLLISLLYSFSDNLWVSQFQNPFCPIRAYPGLKAQFVSHFSFYQGTLRLLDLIFSGPHCL